MQTVVAHRRKGIARQAALGLVRDVVKFALETGTKIVWLLRELG
jgi:hypothetical protein